MRVTIAILIGLSLIGFGFLTGADARIFFFVFGGWLLGVVAWGILEGGEWR
jgi:hypothetical protein